MRLHDQPDLLECGQKVRATRDGKTIRGTIMVRRAQPEEYFVVNPRGAVSTKPLEGWYSREHLTPEG